MSSKLPAFQFYPGDWRKDMGVQSLSFHDRGVWWEMLCLMHGSERRGVLVLNGQAMSDETIARLLGLDKQILTTTLTILLTSGVASRDDETGAIYCRRMVRDEYIRKVRSEAGSRGGNPVLLKQIPTTGVKQIPTPSARKMKTEDEVPVFSETGFDGTELSVANAILSELSIPTGEKLLQLVAQALAFERKRLGSAQKAIRSLSLAMRAVQGSGVKWFLWFQDQGYIPQRNGKHAPPDVLNSWTPEACATREADAETSERESYFQWRGMSETFRKQNPWKGKVYEPEPGDALQPLRAPPEPALPRRS